MATIPVILAVPGGYDSSDPGGARSDLDRSLILVALAIGGSCILVARSRFPVKEMEHM